MLIIRRLPRLGTAPNAPPGRWVYLGMDQRGLTRCRGAFGQDRQLDVTEDFHRVAGELRGPFLNEISRLGSLQNDPLGWCSSSFAFKNPTGSDLFTLSCYRVLLERLGRSQKGTLVAVIEDSWLYEQCRRDAAAGRLKAQCGPRARLASAKLRLSIRAALSRVHWLARTMLNLVRQKRLSGRVRSAGRFNTLLYSLPHSRCLVDGQGWKDPFLGELDRILNSMGLSVGRLAPTGAPGFERELAKRTEYVHAMILDVTWGGLWRSFTALWRPAAGRFSVSGIDLPLLAEREWWIDFGYARWCEYRLFYECAVRLLRRLRPQAVIYPYENLSWEKMLILAARACGVTALGYQHALIGRFELNYYLGEGEAGRTPLPDRILTSGDAQRQALIGHGTPETLCRTAGSLRHGYLRGAGDLSPRPGKRVLVLLGHQRASAEFLLQDLSDAFPDRGAADCLSFHLRPHPTLDFIGRDQASWMPLVQGELAGQLSQFDVLLAAGGTPLVEGRMQGIPGVVYLPGTVVDSTDASHFLPPGSVLIATRADLARQVRLAASLGNVSVSPELARLREALFSRVDEAVWRHSLSAPADRAGVELAP